MGTGDPAGPAVLKAFQYSGGWLSQEGSGKDVAGDEFVETDGLAVNDGGTNVQPITRTAAQAAANTCRYGSPIPNSARGRGGTRSGGDGWLVISERTPALDVETNKIRPSTDHAYASLTLSRRPAVHNPDEITRD